MAALPYIQLYVADYIADTMHLSTEEHGAYLLIIMNYWQTGKPIPKKRLASISRLNGRWTDVEDTLSEFFNDDGECWQHDRIDEDLHSVMEKQTQASKAGKASAAARRAKKQQDANANLTSAGTDVSDPLERKGNHTDTDTEKDKLPKGNSLPESGNPGEVDEAEEVEVPKTEKLPCPHTEIINLYHEKLPCCPAVKDWNKTRQSYLRARWNEDPKRQSLEYWERLFDFASKSEFLTGRAEPSQPGKPPFVANLEWMVKPTNFSKVIEGQYNR